MLADDELTEVELSVIMAARSGEPIDFAAGADLPESYAPGELWEGMPVVRAAAIAELVKGVRGPVQAIRIDNAHIVGELDLELASLLCPLALFSCHFDHVINLREARATTIRLHGCQVPGIRADQLHTTGSLELTYLRCQILILSGARIDGYLVLSGTRLSNSDGAALEATRLTVDKSVICREGFTAEGAVRLMGASIGGDLDLLESRLFDPEGWALDLEAARMTSLFLLPATMPEGTVDLSSASVRNFYDDMPTWPRRILLDGFAYEHLRISSGDDAEAARERLFWLNHHPGFDPGIYDQLATTFRRVGRAGAARRVLIAKHQRRRKELNLAGRAWSWLRYVTTGYGHRPWLAVLWLFGLLAVVFASANLLTTALWVAVTAVVAGAVGASLRE